MGSILNQSIQSELTTYQCEQCFNLWQDNVTSPQNKNCSRCGRELSKSSRKVSSARKVKRGMIVYPMLLMSIGLFGLVGHLSTKHMIDDSIWRTVFLCLRPVSILYCLMLLFSGILLLRRSRLIMHNIGRVTVVLIFVVCLTGIMTVVYGFTLSDEQLREQASISQGVSIDELDEKTFLAFKKTYPVMSIGMSSITVIGFVLFYLSFYRYYRKDEIRGYFYPNLKII